MPKRESSAEMSSLASEILEMKPRPGLAGATVEHNQRYVPVLVYNDLLEKAHSLAGSVMSQDETPGGA